MVKHPRAETLQNTQVAEHLICILSFVVQLLEVFDLHSPKQFGLVMSQCHQLLSHGLAIVDIFVLNHTHMNITPRNEQESWYDPLVIQLHV